MSFAIDATAARAGSEEFSRGAKLMIRDATAAQKAIDELNRAVQGGAGSVGGGAQVTQLATAANQRVESLRREQQVQRELEADRRRAAREQSRADAELLRSRQRAEKSALTALSTLGGENRALAQRIQFEQRLKQAVDAGVISEQRAIGLRRQATEVFSTQAVRSRDLRLNMLGLNASVNQLSSAFSVLAFGPLSGVGARMLALNTAVQIGGLRFAALAAGAATAAIALSSLVSSGNEAERSLARIDGVLRATGGAAGLTTERINELALEIGRNTLASTGDVRDAAAQLLTFRSIAGETFERTLRSAQDLAELGFGTIQSSTVQLAKALEDPATNLANLRRVGVSFTRAQEEQIKALAESGRLLDAQNLLLEQIERQAGGTAEAVGRSTLAGAFDTLGENVKNAAERLSIASGILDTIRNTLNAVNDIGFGSFDKPQLSLVELRRQLDENLSAQSTSGATLPLVLQAGELRDQINAAGLAKVAEIQAQMAGDTEQLALAQERAADTSDALREKYDKQFRAARELESVQRSLAGAVELGAIKQAEADQILASARADLFKKDNRAAEQAEKRRVALEREVVLLRELDDFERQRIEARLERESTTQRDPGLRSLALERETLKLRELADAEADAARTSVAFARSQTVFVAALEAGETPAQKLKQRIDEITQAYEDLKAAGVNVTEGDLTQALSSTEEKLAKIRTAQEEFQQAGERSLQSLSNGFQDLFTGLIAGTTSSREAFEQFGQRTVAALLDVAAQLVIVNTLSSALNAVSSSGTLGSQLTGSPGIGSLLGGFLGGLFGFAQGGIVTGPTLGLIGETGKTETVLPFDIRQANLGGQFVVNINQAPGTEVEAEQGTDPQGRMTLDIAVNASVERNVARGGNVLRGLTARSNVRPTPSKRT